MTNIRKRVAALIIAVASVFGVLGLSSAASAAPARPAVTATSYTDCGQSAFLGARVCFDKTTGFGPVVYIYTSGTSLYATFGVAYVDVGFGSFVATPLEYVVGSVNNVPSGNISIAPFLVAGPPFNQISTQGNTNNKALLDWFANDANYEFVVAN